MNKKFDVIVLGLGAHGSAAVYHLSGSGYAVAGIDRFMPPHSFGSSHGQSRIIRQAYHESPMYVPLVMEAYNLWHELENISGKQLLIRTGGIFLGHEEGMVVKGARLSAETHKVAYEYLKGDEIAERFPALRPAEDTVAVLEQEAGILFPEECIKTNLELAAGNGAALFYNEMVRSVISEPGCITITTDKNTYQSKKIIITVGAWLNELLPELQLPLSIKRQVVFWFKNTDAQIQPFIQPGKLPVYIWEYTPGRMFYGFPDLGKGLKIAPHHEGQPVHPDLLSKDVTTREIEQVQSLANTYFSINAVFDYSDVCMYTNTPDEHFIIDHHPENNNIIIASPCSGHGFKFSSVTGKILADMATGQDTGFDLSPFSTARFFRQ